MRFKSFLAIMLAELLAFAPISMPVFAQTTAQLLPPGKQCFQATAGVNGMVGTIGTITGGSNYTAGSYGGVALTGGSGTNATANITVAGGVVNAVTILNPGAQYVVGDVLSAAAASIGGTGSGFSFPVASTSINSSLAGGSVAYYIPSTLTVKQTWQNAAESVLNQNPVPLDANGCAIVYGSGSYRQILKDPLGNTVWDVVTASPSGGSSGGGGTTFSAGVPVGTILPWSSTALPANYLYTAGQTVSRTTYAQLLTAITFSQTISCQIGVATITVATSVSDGTPIGAPIEASCFAPGTTVLSKVSGTLTMSNNATSTASVPSTIFPWGDGDGSTTFNLPDLRGRAIAGRDNMNSSIAGTLSSTYYGSNPDALAALGGVQSTTLTAANSPTLSASGTGTGTASGSNTVNVTGNFSGNIPYTPGNIATFTTGAAGSGNGPGGSGNWFNFGTSLNSSGSVTINSSVSVSVNTTTTGTSSTPFSRVQPSVTADYIIKVLADTTTGGLTGPSNGVLYNAAGYPGETNVGVNGQLLLGVTGSPPQLATMSQDCAITNAGVITCLFSNGVPFSPSATTDATNANNITTGTLAIARGGSSQGTALAARSSTGFNIDEATSTGDANYVILSTDRSVYHTALSAARTDTLPAANSVNAGQEFYSADIAGVATASHTITLQRAGSDTINGGTTFLAINAAYGLARCASDGVSKWLCTQVTAGSAGGVTGVTIAAGAGIAVTGTCNITTSGTCTIAASAAGLGTPQVCDIISTSATTCNNGGSAANNGTYTTPTGALYLEVKWCTAGGGGGGSNASGSSGAGGTGGATTFGTSLFGGTGGIGGAGTVTGEGGGAGGTATGGYQNVAGSPGSAGDGPLASGSGGSQGGGSPYYAGGGTGVAGAGVGVSGVANTGGGAGGGTSGTSITGGGGGGSGGCGTGIISSPAATYSYAIGAGGTAGVAGAGGSAGGVGAAGRITVIAH